MHCVIWQLILGMESSRHTARQTKSFSIPRERPHAKRGSDLPATKSRLVRIVHTLLTVMPGCTEPKYLNCVRRLEDVLVSRCTNPSCEARFKYLHESRLFQFPSASTPNGVSKSRLNFAFYFGGCARGAARQMTLIQIRRPRFCRGLRESNLNLEI